MKADYPQYLRCLEALKDSSFFHLLATPALQELLAAMNHKYWHKGDFRYNLESQFNFIVSGRLKVYRCNPRSGREHTIFLLLPGDVFDFIALLDEEPHDVCWEAIEQLEVLTLPVAQMRHWIDRNPSMHQHILKYLGKRIRQLEHAKTDISLYTTLVRLAKLLLENMDIQSHKLTVLNDLPNEEIASLIGTTRAVVNRHLQELKNCGAISLKHREIVVDNVNLLLSIAEEKYVPKSHI